MTNQPLRIIHFCLVLALVASIGLSTSSPYFTSRVVAAPLPLIPNSSFEEGDFAPTGSPTGWSRDLYDPSGLLTWDDTQAHSGSKSVKIEATTPNDARWIQTVNVQPNTLYELSGWIKTENVGHSPQEVDAGANISLLGEYIRTPALIGTHDWTWVSQVFNSGSHTQLVIAPRLGFWSGTTTGIAWFDDLQLRRFTPQAPHPSWKILVLIYGQTDFTFTDKNGVVRHAVATMTEAEKQRAAESARLFVTEDIPALNSGNMIPTVTIRFPERVLNQLSPFGEGWSAAPQDTAAERDPAFDSVIVIWDPRATDLISGQAIWIGGAGGLTYGTGTGQTYFEMVIEGAALYDHRNVFKHEWGHAILGYYAAAGISPQPTVTNHAGPGDYVHCVTGATYVWEDETLSNPIPNSIYSNAAGFTHDYYSGLTATPDQPLRCLGITALAWATGGSVSKPTGAGEETRNLLISSTTSGKVQGIKFNDEDILRYSLETDTWQLYFDGSDVGIRGDVNALAVAPDGNLLLSFNSPQTLPGLGEVDDSDIVKFIPAALGAQTAGMFEWYVDGSDVDLTTDGEDVDAISFTAANQLVISTIGDVDVNNAVSDDVEGKNEDLVLLQPTALGATTAGVWSFYFDGSDVRLHKGKGELSGVWLDQTSSDIYLGTRGNFAVDGLSGDGNDLFICAATALGANSSCTFRSFWDGNGAGFAGEVIDAFTFVSASAPGNEVVSAALDKADEAQEPDSEDSHDASGENEGTGSQLFLPTVLH